MNTFYNARIQVPSTKLNATMNLVNSWSPFEAVQLDHSMDSLHKGYTPILVQAVSGDKDDRESFTEFLWTLQELIDLEHPIDIETTTSS